jgi:acyl-CoA thioesterase FadM
MSGEQPGNPMFGNLKNLEEKSRLIQRGTENFFEQNGTDVNVSYFLQVDIEPSTHPLVKDPQKEAVYSYTSKLEEADADGYLSFGVFVKLIDDATSLAAMGIHKNFDANVSLSMDFKQFKKMQIGRRLLILSRVQQSGTVYCVVHFETYDEDHQLLNQGTHTKVYLDTSQKL